MIMIGPEFCHVVVPGAAPGKRIGIVKRGKKGYYLTNFDSPKASGRTISDFVAGMNALLGVNVATQTTEVTVEFSNPDYLLRSGLNVTVQLSIRAK